MSRYKVKKIVQQYAAVLREHNFLFSHLYLFGSYAQGKADTDSDIDIAIIGPYNAKNYWDRKKTLWRLAPEVDTRIEPILLSQKDFEKGNTQIANEIKKTGVRVE